MIKLGVKVKDRMTGQEGIVVSRHQYLTGCDRYAYQPPMDKDGKVPEIQHADETMLDIIDDEMVVEPHAQEHQMEPEENARVPRAQARPKPSPNYRPGGPKSRPPPPRSGPPHREV